MPPHQDFDGPIVAPAQDTLSVSWIPPPNASSLLALERQLQEDPPAGFTWRYHSLQGVTDIPSDAVRTYMVFKGKGPEDSGVLKIPIMPFSEFERALHNNT